MVTWVEPGAGNSVVHMQDFENGIGYTDITDIASKGFWNVKGTITAARTSASPSQGRNLATSFAIV